MKRIDAKFIGIQQGSRMLFSHFIDDGPMWTGQGERELRYHVNFPEAYREAPGVMVSIGLCDSDHKHNFRTDISADNITTTGFDVIFRTWGDTRIARVRADWVAIGAVHDADDWQLY